MRWKKEKVDMSYIMYPTPLASPIFYQIRFSKPITNYSLTQSFILLDLNKADNPIIQKRAAKELLPDCRQTSSQPFNRIPYRTNILPLSVKMVYPNSDNHLLSCFIPYDIIKHFYNPRYEAFFIFFRVLNDRIVNTVAMLKNRYCTQYGIITALLTNVKFDL